MTGSKLGRLLPLLLCGVAGLALGFALRGRGAGEIDLRRSIEASPIAQKTSNALAGTADSPSTPLSFEESRQRTLRTHEANLVAHAAEARDAIWAHETEKTLASDLEKASQRGKYRVNYAECRTTTCVARLTFPNYSIAQANASTVAASHTVRCRSEVVPHDPADVLAEYSTDVFFDCAESRKAPVP